jgi:hypothetical protein
MCWQMFSNFAHVFKIYTFCNVQRHVLTIVFKRWRFSLVLKRWTFSRFAILKTSTGMCWQTFSNVERHVSTNVFKRWKACVDKRFQTSTGMCWQTFWNVAGNGTTGVIVVAIIYIGFIMIFLVGLYTFMLNIHMRGRILDTFRRYMCVYVYVCTYSIHMCMCIDTYCRTPSGGICVYMYMYVHTVYICVCV